MSPRYAPLPNNPTPDLDAQRELDDAFDDSDDDDDSDETKPLTAHHRSASQFQPQVQSQAPTSTTPTYDFENVDYDLPPPGSPPRPSSRALPNEFGNSNGLVPTFDETGPSGSARWRWFKGLIGRGNVPQGAVGGGGNNDGVFANVTAKPTPPVRIQDGDDTYIVPEDARTEAPPSYSSAQADAVPSYWETTVHVPFSADSSELIIDSLPTGSLFSFLWNLLVSVSFQFIGFLLTYLLHTTHAARLGSRAGLGITLIQYGFALRSKIDNSEDEDWRLPGDPMPTFGSAQEANAYAAATNRTLEMIADEQANVMVADATAEWLSFFLMTVGWFILLTSLLGYWRVKRWERGIINSQLENPHAADRPTGELPVLSRLERMVGFRGIGMAPGDFFRQGLGFSTNQRTSGEEAIIRAEEGHPPEDDVDGLGARETDLMIPADMDPEEYIQSVMQERRLQADLRAAGFL